MLLLSIIVYILSILLLAKQYAISVSKKLKTQLNLIVCHNTTNLLLLMLIVEVALLVTL